MSSTATHPRESERIDTSIVLATCNRAGMLRPALESLLQQGWAEMHPTEIIVVDDGSSDNTPDVLAELQKTSPIPFTVVQGERMGVAAARNTGSERARGVWLASFDDDQIALPGWLQAMRELAEVTGAACIGGALTLKLPPGVELRSLGPRVRRVLGEHLLGDAPVPYPGDSHPATNNVLIRRDLFLELGGYDARFTEGGEDKDFFYRAANAGYQMWFQPLSPGLHVMTPKRLEHGNLRWTSLRLGASDVRVKRLNGHIAALLSLALVRLGVAVLRDAPMLLAAKVRNDQRAKLDVYCSLWYTEGLLRAMMPILSGHAEHSKFLQSIDFRSRNGERTDSTRRPGTTSSSE